MSFSNATVKTVKELIAKSTFIVPEFQRGYAWQKEHWRALWEDVVEIERSATGQHYGGVIMLKRHGRGGRLSVVDGQQRLTSISLMLASLGIDGLEIEYESNEALQTYYDYFARGRQHLKPRLRQHRSFYSSNLQAAAEYFQQRAEEVDVVDRPRLITALLEQVQLFVLEIAPNFDVHVAFETINNRGKPLSTLEKLKNRLIYLASKATSKRKADEAMREIHRAWKGIYTSLGAGEKLLDDDHFLRAHAMGWFRHARKTDWLSTELFDHHFGVHSSVSCEDLIAYVQNLERISQYWHFLHSPDLLPPLVQKSLHALEKAPAATSKPMLLWALSRLRDDAGDRSSGVKVKNGSWVEPFSALVNEAERFAVLVVLGNGRQANVGRSDLTRSAYALAHPGTRIYDHISSPLPPSDSIAAVTFATDHLKSLTLNVDKAEARLDPRFDWRGHFNADDMRRHIHGRFHEHSGFYNWPFGKLVLYLWEDWLRGIKGRPERRPWERFAWDESVEHIYPQSPVADWQLSISTKGKKSAPGVVANSLGNLLLLSRSLNSSLSNHTYLKSEVSEGKRKRFEGGSYSEVQVSKVCEQWTVLHIAARGIAMMRLAQKHWRFELVSPGAPLTDWLPFLFADQTQAVLDGYYSNGDKLSTGRLKNLVARFEVHPDSR